MKKKRILLGLGAFAALGFATVLASCDAKKFTVRFYDGETELTELAETVTNGYNAEVPTAPTKDGKVFNGWYKDANLTEAYDFGSIVSGDVSIYARWETQMHTVNLYTEKGKLWKSVSIANGKTLTFEGTPTKNYRVFSGTWYTDAECKNAFNASTAITKATDLYAGWVGETENVDFEFLASDFPTATVGADGWSSGCFSAGEGSEFRTESGKSYNGVSYTHGVKLNGTKSFFAINAEGTGKITVVMADRGSLTAVNLQGPGDTEPKEKTLTINSKVAALEIDVDQVGLYKISLATGGGTPDIMYVKYETSVLKSAPESIDITGYKTQFLEGTDFTVADLAAELNYENGRKDAIDKTALEVDSTAFDKTTPGTYTIKVKYSITDSYDTYNLEKTYDVQVLALDDIELGFNKVSKSKTNTKAGNGQYINNTVSQVIAKNGTVDLNSLTIKAQSTDEEFFELYTKDSTFTAENSKVEISAIDATTTGHKTVTVKLTLNGVEKTKTFNVDVTDVAPVEKNGAIQLYVDPAYEGVAGAKNADESANQFKTIQQALDYLAAQKNIDAKAKVIQLAEGTYNEKLEITVPNLTIKGAATAADKAKYKIEWDSVFGVNDESGFTNVTDSTQTVAIRESAVNCTISGVTISNYYNNIAAYAGVKTEVGGDMTGNGERGLALLVQSDKFIMENGALLGWQDTLETFTGRQYFKNCYIQGCVDYIFGTNSATYFDGCEIHTVKGKAGAKDGSAAAYVTAYKGNNKDANDVIEYGAVFNNCNFTVDEDFVGYVCVGRNWAAYTSVAVLNSTFSDKFATKASEAINGSLNAKNNVTTLKYRFFGNKMGTADFAFEEDIKDANDAVINHAITAEEAAKITVLTVFAPTNGKVTFADAWGGQLAKDANVVFKAEDDTVLQTLENVTYAGSYFTEAQYKELFTPAEGKVVDGLYTDKACTTKFDFTKPVETETVIYVKYATAKTMQSATVTSDDVESISSTGDTQWGTLPVYFKKTSQAWTIDANAKTITKVDGTTYKTTNRVKSGNANTMLIDLSEYGGTVAVTVWAMSGSSNTERTITVKEQGTSTTLYTSKNDGNAIGSFVYYLAAGTKYELTTSAGINFYGITLENVYAEKTWTFRTDTNTGTEVKSFGTKDGADVIQSQGAITYVDTLTIDSTGYYEVASVTEWAANTKYYTLADGKYTEVDQTAVTAPAEGTTYYVHKNGKFALRAQQWAQMNKGTTLSLKVAKNSVVTFNVYTAASFTYQIGSAEAVALTNNTTTIKVTEDTVVTLTAVANDYIDSVSVAPVTNTVSLDLNALTSPVEKGTTQGIFTIYGKDVADTTDASRKVNIKENSTYGKYLELAGGGTVAYKSAENEKMPANCVAVTVQGAGTIKVTLQNKKASDDSNYTGKDCKAVVLQRVTAADGTLSQKSVASSTTKMAASDQAPTEFEFAVTEAGTYCVGFSHHGGYIYAISFTAA